MQPQQLNVLYVDDEETNLIVFNATFKNDFIVYTASSVEQALKILQERSIDVVLTDERMPDMSGMEFLEILKNEYPQIARLIVSGYADSETIHEAIQSGCVFQSISKPWDEQALKTAIQEAVKSQPNKPLTEKKAPKKAFVTLPGSSFVVSLILLCLVPPLLIVYLTFSISEPGLKNEMEMKLGLIANQNVQTLAKSQDHAQILATCSIEHLQRNILWVVGLTFPLLAYVLYRFITQQIRVMNAFQHHERLASIGILVAGVAHEINNPVNFILSNVKCLKKNIGNVLNVLKMYDNHVPVQDIAAYKKESHFDITEMDQLLQGLGEGAERTAAIVKGLKSFTRSDTAQMQKVAILEGLDSTLELLKSHTQGRIEVIKEYAKIPLVECYPEKLNQVFMNLLSNAIDAIRKDGKIFIKVVKSKRNEISISIKDNGEGISAENQSKIFMPFFTTKTIGQGTGLGLSITHNIILEHHGTIIVNSSKGCGAEFIITLPISQS